ncbi:MAG TPA: hypothetical protein VNK95_06760, partial [Caldilineaceae bacterium]|nr:hypothetical protein [Caldilineaceae bacterium]
MASHEPHANGHAVIIGGSMAGLCAARVLAGHVNRVTIVERDHLPAEPSERKGVPHARHVHVLLAQGQRVLEQLFPGLTGELAGHGALIMDWTAECMTRYATGWGRRMPSNLRTLGCSRDLLEWAVRQRVRALPNVAFCEGMEATGLLTDPTNRAIQGVMVRPRGEGKPEALAADLVVDASGRGSHSPDWLEALGYGRPRETIVNAFLGYASRWYRKPAGFKADWKALLITGYPPDMPYGGVLLPVEGDRWLVTLGGRNRQYPPTDEAGFLDFARQLADP